MLIKQTRSNTEIQNVNCVFRSAHYPPETSSIMLMAKMVAVVKQVLNFLSLFHL